MDDKPDTNEKTAYEPLMRRIAVAVLVIGLSVAAVVFVMTPAETERENAGVQLASASNSKQVRLEVERYGGKTAVLAAEFSEWADGLWRGRRLAGTLAGLAVVVSLLCFLAARLPPLDD